MPIIDVPEGTSAWIPQILNAKWDHALGWFTDAIGMSNAAAATVGTAPRISPLPSIAWEGEMPEAPSDLPISDPDAAIAYFDSKNRELSAQIDQAFHQILQIAFPDMSVLSAAMAWCKRALTTGGTGINANVEAALWERGRARISSQAERDVASTTEQYARAGWPLPPGAMLYATAQIRQDARDKLAEQSRDISIKSFEAEVENVRLAVKTAGDMFAQALQAVGDYVKTVMLGPQVAMQLATSTAGLKNEAARTLVNLYQAQTAALEPLIRIKTTDAELKERANEANQRAATETAQMRVQTVLANVKMVGDAAAASLNGIGAGVNAGTSISYDGGSLAGTA